MEAKLAISLEECLVGEELIRVTLEHSSIELIFQQRGIQLFTVFQVKIPDKEYTEIDLFMESGMVNMLWNLIGISVKKVVISSNFILTFNNNVHIICKRNENRPVGTIQTLDLKTYDEF